MELTAAILQVVLLHLQCHNTAGGTKAVVLTCQQQLVKRDLFIKRSVMLWQQNMPDNNYKENRPIFSYKRNVISTLFFT